MSNPRVPLDPDPRFVDEDDLWDPAANAWVQRPSGLVALLVGLALGTVIGFLFAINVVHAAAPRSAQPVIPAVATVPEGGASGNPAELTGAPERTANPAHAWPAMVGTAGAPPSSATEPDAIAAGVASWYPADGLIAAVPGWHWGDTPYPVRVSAGGRSVVVTVSDCLCGRTDRIIDLSDDAFRRLAPLSAGVLRVTVEWVGAGLTPPPTDLGG